VAERCTQLSVRPVIGDAPRASTNRMDGDGIRDVVAEAIAIARLTERTDLLRWRSGAIEPRGSSPRPRRRSEARARASGCDPG
jgi:hypothetical protein